MPRQRRHARRALSLVTGLLLLTGVGCIYPTGPIEWERWRPSFPSHAQTPVVEKVEAIEKHMKSRHVAPEGFLVYRRPDRPFVAGEASSYANLADVPIWTGCMLAGAAFKYGVTGEPQDREFVLRVLDGVRLLERVTGEPGLLARCVVPTTGPMKGEKPRHKGRQGAPPLERYRYRGDVSKDQYFGILFGCAAVYEVFGRRESPDIEVISRAAETVGRIADFFWRNELQIVDADGEVTTYGDLSGYMFGIPIGPNASLNLAFQRLAALTTGEGRFEARYQELVRREYPEATWLNKFQILAITNHNNDVMAMMALYTLGRFEQEARRAAIYHESLRHLWELVRNEGNLFYHNVYASVTGDELPEPVRQDYDAQMLLFPVDLRLRPVDLREAPQVDPGFWDERSGRERNRTALPLHVRKLSSFIWKSSPYALTGNEQERGERTISGVGFWLAYWMGRYHGVID